MSRHRWVRMTVAAAWGVWLAGVSSVHAAAPQVLVPARSELTFVAKQFGVAMPGHFKQFAVQSSLDPKAWAGSQIAFQVDLASVTLNPDADTELRKPEWFNVGKFPKASFQSSSIRAVGPGKLDVAGKLTIKGISRDVVVPVQIVQSQGLSTATGSLLLKRLDFKVGDGDWADPAIVANEVQVQFKLVLQGMPSW